MKIAIANNGRGDIITISELSDPESKGEVAHFIAELEIIKWDLLNIWESMKDWEE